MPTVVGPGSVVVDQHGTPEETPDPEAHHDPTHRGTAQLAPPPRLRRRHDTAEYAVGTEVG